MFRTILISAATALAFCAPPASADSASHDACARQYFRAPAIAACEQRLALQKRFEDQELADQAAAEKAEQVRLYGSLDAAAKFHARMARIDKVCMRRVGLDNAQAFARCEAREEERLP